MKKIGFIGTYDKTDLLLNLAKVLTVMNYRMKREAAASFGAVAFPHFGAVLPAVKRGLLTRIKSSIIQFY